MWPNGSAKLPWRCGPPRHVVRSRRMHPPFSRSGHRSAYEAIRIVAEQLHTQRWHPDPRRVVPSVVRRFRQEHRRTGDHQSDHRTQVPQLLRAQRLSITPRPSSHQVRPARTRRSRVWRRSSVPPFDWRSRAWTSRMAGAYDVASLGLAPEISGARSACAGSRCQPDRPGAEALRIPHTKRTTIGNRHQLRREAPSAACCS